MGLHIICRLFTDYFLFSRLIANCFLVLFCRSPGGELGAKKKKKKQKRKKEKTNSGGTKSDSASDSQEIKNQQPSKVRDWPLFSYPYFTLPISDNRNMFLNEIIFVN